MNEKQQQLTFDKGITNAPSDALCSDNALEECVGLVYDNGEHRVIQNPITFIDSAYYVNENDENVPIDIPTVLYIHKFNDVDRYITLNGSYIEWGTKVGDAYQAATETITTTEGETEVTTVQVAVLLTVSGTPIVNSIGKTLIITDDNGIHYFLWKEDSYKDIGPLPSPDVEFFLYGRIPGAAAEVSNSGSVEGILTSGNGIENGQQEAYNNLVIGLYSKNKIAVAQKKEFCEPFFVRTAIELYDGTYTHISQPIILFPSISENSWCHITATREMHLETSTASLMYINKSKLGEWSDIAKNVVVFITDGIGIYDLAVDQPNPTASGEGKPLSDGVYRVISSDMSLYHTDEATGELKVLKKRPQSEIEGDVRASSLFYRLCGIGIHGDNTIKSIAEHVKIHDLENLTTNERLDSDDYFSRSTLFTKYLITYNSRLNIANVSRSLFEGYHDFLPYDNSSANVYTFYVTISTDSGEKIVRHQKSTTQKQGIYFYYPDSRAKHVMIFKKASFSDTGDGDCILDNDLEEHSFLNGAFYFRGMPTSSEQETPVTNPPSPPSDYTYPDPERLANYVLQSEVNNPFVFKAAGYFKVGTGRIVGISTITQALSEGQFGQFPLLVFSESGIWSLSVASTGYYDSIHPMSREVPFLDNPCITQTDGAVFFASEKGLMVVVGSQVKCVSEQLGGMSDMPFANFLKHAIIAYDYRDSLLWIFDTSTHGAVVGSQYCWIYSIKSGTFARYDFGNAIRVTNVVNNYPDYLLQAGGTVYSLLERPDINQDGTTSGSTFTPYTYSAQMKTRALKLENALALKSLMQVRHVLQFSPYTVTETHEDPETHESVTTETTQKGTMTMKIFASNNLDNWAELHSLRGMPWKYYKFQYDFSNLIATDRFAGTMLITQERRTNKLR